MSSELRHTAYPVADQLSRVGPALYRMAMAALNLQGMALSNRNRRGLGPEGLDPLSRAAGDALNSLHAVSRNYLQDGLPQLRELTEEFERIATQAAAVEADFQSPLSGHYAATSTRIESCREALADVMRKIAPARKMVELSEQRLWGALTTELIQREENSGKMSRACTRIETMSFDLAALARDVLADQDRLSLGNRVRLGFLLCDLAIHPIREARDQVDMIARISVLIGENRPDLVRLSGQILAEYCALGRDSREIALVLSLAMQTSLQLMLAGWLFDALQELDCTLDGLARACRALAAQAKRPDARVGLLQSLGKEAALWHRTAVIVSAPFAVEFAATAFLRKAGARSAAA